MKAFQIKKFSQKGTPQNIGTVFGVPLTKHNNNNCGAEFVLYCHEFRITPYLNSN